MCSFLYLFFVCEGTSGGFCIIIVRCVIRSFTLFRVWCVTVCVLCVFIEHWTANLEPVSCFSCVSQSKLKAKEDRVAYQNNINFFT